ncbi:MAG: hypothetical protein J2P15_06370 [Micromonosporaceae bacterium]|nr:hypothetical protein [Micromonosporaceae bacterium]
MRIRTKLMVIGAAAAAASLLGGIGVAAADGNGEANRNGAYEIGLIGDMPYGPTGRAQYPNVIADINQHRLAFTAFDGDIKNGSERCDQPIYDAALASFKSFADPLVYVPGDNEWTDCDRASNGSYDPNERLALIRSMFAATPTSFGQHTLPLLRQSAAYPENVRWQYGPVTYVGLNIPGSDNNAPQFDSTGKQIDGDAAEYTARNAANLAWLDQAFAAARAANSVAVMVVIQADMWSTDPTAHFADTKAELARLAIGFHRPVVLVNGDSHVLRIDNPLTDAAGNPILNVTRVQTFGSALNHWVSATVDPRDPEVFTFHQHIIAANLPSYVSP